MIKWFAERIYENQNGNLSWKERAFSLGEILVGVAVVALLTSIATPVYLSQRDKGYKATAAADATAWAAEVTRIVEKYTTLGPAGSDPTQLYENGGEPDEIFGDISLDAAAETLTVTVPVGSQLSTTLSSNTPIGESAENDNARTVTTNINMSETESKIRDFAVAPLDISFYKSGYMGAGATKAWCFVVENNGEFATATSEGVIPGQEECSPPNILQPPNPTPNPAPDPTDDPTPGDPGDGGDAVLTPCSVPPDPPTNVVAVPAGNDSLPVAGFKVEWRRSADADCDPNTWTVRYKQATASGDAWKILGDYPVGGSNQAQMAGLKYGTTYDVAVAASNSFGQSDWVGTTVNTGFFAPEPPYTTWTFFCDASYNTTVEFNWLPYSSTFPSPKNADGSPQSTFNGGGEITTFGFQYKASSDENFTSPPTLNWNLPNRTLTFNGNSLRPDVQYDYNMTVNSQVSDGGNVQQKSATRVGTFSFADPSNPPTETLPKPNISNTFLTDQQALWNANPAEMKDFIFTISAPEYPCGSIALSGYEVEVFEKVNGRNVQYAAGSWKKANEGTFTQKEVGFVDNGSTVKFQAGEGGGDREFVFRFTGVPNVNGFSKTLPSDFTPPILTAPNPPSTQGITTWTLVNGDTNTFRAEFNRPDKYRTTTEFRVNIESYIPTSNSDVLGVNDGGKVKEAPSGTWTTSNSNDYTCHDPNMVGVSGTKSIQGLAVNCGVSASGTPGGNPLTERGNKVVTGWTPYGYILNSFSSNSRQGQTFKLNGTTNYYYSVVAKNATGESWTSAELAQQKGYGPTKIGVRSYPEAPQKPRVGGLTGDPMFRNAIIVWGFENSDQSQRLFLTVDRATVNNNSPAAKQYTYDYTGRQTGAMVLGKSDYGLNLPAVYPSYSPFNQVRGKDARTLYPCIDNTASNYFNDLYSSKVLEGVTDGENNSALRACIDTVKTEVGYKSTSDIPGWAFNGKPGFYVRNTFSPKACNFGITPSGSSYATSTDKFQCAKSVQPSSYYFIPPDPASSRGAKVYPNDPTQRVQYEARTVPNGGEVRLWDGINFTGDLSRSFHFRFSGYMQGKTGDGCVYSPGVLSQSTAWSECLTLSGLPEKGDTPSQYVATQSAILISNAYSRVDFSGAVQGEIGGNLPPERREMFGLGLISKVGANSKGEGGTPVKMIGVKCKADVKLLDPGSCKYPGPWYIANSNSFVITPVPGSGSTRYTWTATSLSELFSDEHPLREFNGLSYSQPPGGYDINNPPTWIWYEHVRTTGLEHYDVNLVYTIPANADAYPGQGSGFGQPGCNQNSFIFESFSSDWVQSNDYCTDYR